MSSGPWTPERSFPGAQAGGIRRSFTVPAKLETSRSANAPSSPGTENIETLFTHSFARVVSFTSQTPTASADRRSSLPSTSHAGQSMPWGSPTERTMAAGPVKMYRVPNSVSFLNSGNFLHPILPKSQCWCVDDQGKFVLKARGNNYYRIELAYQTEEDKGVIEDFKTTLSKVLQFEKTPCPFRGNYVEDTVETPLHSRKPRRDTLERAKKWKFDRRWKPEGAESVPSDVSEESGPSASEEDDTASIVSSSHEEMSRSRGVSPDVRGRSPATIIDTSGPGIAERTKRLLGNRALTGVLQSPTASYLPSAVPDTVIVTPKVKLIPDVDASASSSFVFPSANASPSNDVSAARQQLIEQLSSPVPVDFRSDHSPATTSPQEALAKEQLDAREEATTNPEARLEPRLNSLETLEENLRSPEASNILTHSTSFDSFYSLASGDPHPRSPSILDSESLYDDPLPDTEALDIQRTLSHKRGISEMTIIPTEFSGHASPKGAAQSSPPIIRIGSEPTTPTLMSDTEDSFEPPLPDVLTPPDAIRLRKLTGASQRRAYSPMPHPSNIISTSRSRSQTRLIASTIVQKTCALLLSPPSHLVELMFRIAARIAAGFGVGTYDLGRAFRIPGSWESAEDEDEYGEDDYGIPLQPIISHESRDGSMSSTNRM
ncbi:hypothetical protein EJ05DRAFT_514707 [Pseudovirgaria hyperparasitica]|uniref:Inheritance of peroxisomes protein 1 n=1 Tax=Pseudovirgaria hyperparasitica TaxID=470096 RepID=A0A6A6VX00_9PEZI|nr:uncharacterized protein EJ05DRAFT_514707 [Pseudovirgaria hyperparasitica]KAF2753771.1 hypothetical protein EJ05DRAFT_514707 [Pseudovirgaria hyperparasitica]